jgi:hypothetical protein
MIVCSICRAPNHHLAVTCSACGSFLQARIDALDLFSTAWKIIERPSRALRSVAIATHKNYVFVLSALVGIVPGFFVLRLVHAGEHIRELFLILAGALSGGLVLGMVGVPMIAVLLTVAAKLTGTSIRFRNAYAVVSYSLLPMLYLAVIVLPIQIMTFGLYLFTIQPAAAALRPTSFILFSILEGAAAVWAIALLAIGVKVLTDSTYWRALAIVLMVLLIVAGGIWWGALQIVPPASHTTTASSTVISNGT